MRTRASRERLVTDLVREREDLLRSLVDLDAELAAGDIDEQDYDWLRSDYIGRIAKTARELERQNTITDPGEIDHRSRRVGVRRWLGRRRTRTVIIATLVLWVLVGVAYTSLHFAGVRLPGEAATGTITLSTALVVQQDLEQASVAASSGNVAQSIELYSAVLAKVPNQHEALTYQGWLIRISGLSARSIALVRKGDNELAHASLVAPGYPDARGLYGVALGLDEHNIAGAIKQFVALRKDHPGVSLLSALGPQVVSIYQQGNVPIPSWIKKYGVST